MTPERYEKIAAPLRRCPGAVRALKGINRVLTALCYVLYPLLLLNLYAARDERLWQCLLVPAAAFVLLSLFRGLWNAPRPYEQGIDSLMKKKTEGRSFPSRHVFSAFVIAMAWQSVDPGVGAALLAVGLLLAVIRVVGGVHYPKDVAAGAAAGVAAWWIGAGIFALLP